MTLHLKAHGNIVCFQWTWSQLYDFAMKKAQNRWLAETCEYSCNMLVSSMASIRYRKKSGFGNYQQLQPVGIVTTIWIAGMAEKEIKSYWNYGRVVQETRSSQGNLAIWSYKKAPALGQSSILRLMLKPSRRAKGSFDFVYRCMLLFCLFVFLCWLWKQHMRESDHSDFMVDPLQVEKCDTLRIFQQGVFSKRSHQKIHTPSQHRMNLAREVKRISRGQRARFDCPTCYAASLA